MMNSFHIITPKILNELDDQVAHYREKTPLKVVTPQDALEILFAIPIITGLGFVLPFLGVYSILALILVVFASWRLGNAIEGMVKRYRYNKATHNSQ